MLVQYSGVESDSLGIEEANWEHLVVLAAMGTARLCIQAEVDSLHCKTS
jgi:hypothetical protein